MKNLFELQSDILKEIKIRKDLPDSFLKKLAREMDLRIIRRTQGQPIVIPRRRAISDLQTIIEADLTVKFSV